MISVHTETLFFLINCWSSVVASVVLPQLVQISTFHFFFFVLSFKGSKEK